MACGLEIFDSVIKLIALVALVAVLLKISYALERWGKK